MKSSIMKTLAFAKEGISMALLLSNRMVGDRFRVAAPPRTVKLSELEPAVSWHSSHPEASDL